MFHVRRLSSVSFRALIALLSIVLLTFCVITTLMLGTTAQQQQQTNVLNQDESTNSLAVLMDNFFYEYFNISSQIIDIPALRPVNLHRENYILSQIDAIAQLRTLVNIDRQLVDLCMYYHDDDYFITSSSSYSAADFINCYSVFNVQDRSCVYDLFLNSRTLMQSRRSIPQFIPLSGAQHPDDGNIVPESLLIMIPVPYWSSNPYGTLGIVVQSTDIIHQLSLAANQGGARILDQNGETLLAVGCDHLPNGFDDTKGVRVFSVPSSRFLLTYETFVSEDALAATDSTPLQLVVFLLLIALAACIACFISARWINLPVHNLAADIGHNCKPLQDETALIQQHIYNLCKTAEDNQHFIDELLIRRLVSGQKLKNADLDRCERMLMHDYSHCAVVLVQLIAPMESLSPLTVFRYDHAVVHVMQESPMTHMLALIACDAHDSSILSYVEQLLREPIFDNTVSATVGLIKEDLRQLHDSLVSAEELLKEMQYQGRTGIEMFQERSEQRSAYPFEAMHNIKYALCTQDAELLSSAAEKVMDVLRDKHTTLDVATILSYDLSAILPELGKPAAGSVSTLRNQLDACIQARIAAFDVPALRSTLEDTDDWKVRVETDIHSLLETPGFGISVLAQKYTMSDSAFSHTFKRNFGINFINYVNQLKIQRAKAYLETTTMNLEAVALQLGYSSSSNFTRMFKSYEGITPSAYRQVALTSNKA